MALPLLGTITKENGGEVVTFIDSLVAESNEVRSRREPQADRNLNLYLGHHWTHESTSDTIERLTVNRIQNAIIAQVAIQTEETPKVKFTPRESLEPPIYYINTALDASPTPDLTALINALPPETKAPWLDENDLDPETQEPKVKPPRPLEPAEVQFVEAAIDAAARNAAMLMQEPTIPPDILVGITDRIAAEALQTIFDAKWDECEGDFKIGENLLYSGIIGWQWMICEWDDDEHMHVLRNVPFLQVHVDPLCTGIKDAQYVIYDQTLSADEACATFPHLQSRIRERAASGNVNPSGTQYRQASVYNINFQNEMISLRTAWLRNQPLPMSVQEAVEKGLIEVIEDTLDVPVECTCGVGVDQPVSAHHESCPCREGYEFNPESLAVPDAPAPEFIADGETPAPPEDPGARMPVQSRKETFTSYKLVETGEVIEEGEKGWPTRAVLRQIRIIADTVVDDRECEYVDIPMSLNVNIPIPYSPYGQGEPERLEGLQQSLNNVLSDLVTHWHYHAQPAEFVPQSVNDARPQFAQEMYNHPAGLKSVIPDEIYRQLGSKVGFYMDPPAAPRDGWQLINLLIQLINDASQQSEVLEGKASPSWSGEAIAALQSAAKGSIGWKSRRTESVLRHVARIMAGNICFRMPLEEQMRYVSKYPAHVFHALSAKMKSMDADLTVAISSGSGAKEKIQAASDLSLFDRKLLSPQTVLESSGHDPKIESHNMAAWAREQQSSQQQMPAGMPATAQQAPQQQLPPGQPQGQEQPSEQPPAAV